MNNGIQPFFKKSPQNLRFWGAENSVNFRAVDQKTKVTYKSNRDEVNHE